MPKHYFKPDKQTCNSAFAQPADWPSRQRRRPRASRLERVDDLHAVDVGSVLHVFGVEPGDSGVGAGGEQWHEPASLELSAVPLCVLD